MTSQLGIESWSAALSTLSDTEIQMKFGSFCAFVDETELKRADMSTNVCNCIASY